jgi:hypothetical protein
MYGTLGCPRIHPILLPLTGVRHHRCHQELLPQRRVLHRRDASSIKSTRSPRPLSSILCAAAGTAEHGLSRMAAPRFLSRTYPHADSLPSISTSYRRPDLVRVSCGRTTGRVPSPRRLAPKPWPDTAGGWMCSASLLSHRRRRPQTSCNRL